MTKIKLKEWADRHNLSYLTANRHFHAGMIPGASQLDSGTILVEDDSPEQNMASNSPNDAMSLFLKKTVEYSKNNSSVEDFAAYVISNFTIKLNNAADPSPKYSKNRPKPEEVQKHFQQFLPDKEKQEHLKAIKNLIETKGAAEVVSPTVPDLQAVFNTADMHTFSEGFIDVDAPIDTNPNAKQILDHMYGSDTNATGGLVNRSVDFDTTPQQINYTGSNGQVSSSFGATSAIVGDVCFTNSSLSAIAGAVPVSNFMFSGNSTTVGSGFNACSPAAAGAYFINNAPSAFQPTQKELLSAVRVIETAETEDSPRGKRGRKPSKKR